MEAMIIKDRAEKSTLSNEYDMSMTDAGLSRKNMRQTGNLYSHIAYVPARGCQYLFYVNVDTGEYIEYRTDDERSILRETERTAGFFEKCEREVRLFIHPEDQDVFVNTMNREFLKGALEQSGQFSMTYRRIKDGKTFYELMKVSRIADDNRFIAISVYNVDELTMMNREEGRIQEEPSISASLHAITDSFPVVFIVEPETGSYFEYSSTDEYKKNLSLAKEGMDFFGMIREKAVIFIHPEDADLFLSAFTKENVIAEIKNSGIFTLGFRLIMKGMPRHVQIKAALVEEQKGSRLIIGLNDIDVQVRQGERIKKRFIQAQELANIDTLTGIQNQNAYLEAERRLDRLIAENRVAPFAVIVMDPVDLQNVINSAGHQAGDRYICNASKIICDIFRRSSVFRISRNEFVVIAQGDDYSYLKTRLGSMRFHNTEALRTGGIVIACGVAKYENDANASAVTQRADQDMHKDKIRLETYRQDR